MGKHSSINRIYRLIWSATHQTWVAASEVARGRGKSCNGALLVTALLSSLGSIAIAAPQGGKVTSGDGSISTTGNTTTIKQTSDRLNLNWQSFNVDKNETVKFDQPSASALAVGSPPRCPGVATRRAPPGSSATNRGRWSAAGVG